jgi:putative ABC transport system ATP-binding protein
MITATNITKTFTQGQLVTPVLKGINLEIKDGEFLVIMGRSGSGKSTLLYILSLLDELTSGELVVAGTNTHELNEQERTEFRLMNLGYIFQDYALVPELTSTENIMVPLLMQGMTMEDAKKQAEKSLDKLGLLDRGSFTPNRLSGGQQQRVSIARAVAHNPKIVFADEPTANLDSVSADSVIELFNDINKEGTTIVMVTHEEKAARYADRIVYLDDGVIVDEKVK